MSTTDTFTVSAPAGVNEVVITREFDAPREKVFAAHVDPEAVAAWWGLRDTETHIDQFDARAGGSWRFVQRGPEGEDAFHGVYHLVNAPEQIVYTFEYEGVPGHVLLETITFEDLGNGRTKVTDHSVYQSLADRDGMVEAGMEYGARQSWDQLEEYLAKA